MAYTARRDSRGGEVTAERRDNYESLDHSLAQSRRGALRLEARSTSVTFFVDRLRRFLDLERFAGAPLVVHMKALRSCTPLTVSSPPSAFLEPYILHSLLSLSLLPRLSHLLSFLLPLFLSFFPLSLFLDGFRLAKKSQCQESGEPAAAVERPKVGFGIDSVHQTSWRYELTS